MAPETNPDEVGMAGRRMSRRKALRYLGGGAVGVAVLGMGGVWTLERSARLGSREAEKVKKARIVVAGGSIGGLTVAARFLRAVPDAEIVVIEPKEEHHYQPGYTLVAAGVYEETDVVFAQAPLFLPGMRWIKDSVARFEPERNRLVTSGGTLVEYDFLVVGLGVEMDLGSVEGLAEALETGYAGNSYMLPYGRKFRDLAASLPSGGRALFTYPKGYVKCGGAPQKICWLSEDKWRSEGRRQDMEVHFLTPQSSVFPVVPVIDEIVKPMMEARGIQHHFHHELKAIDVSTRTAIFLEESENGTTREHRMKYDLIHPMGRFRTPAALRQSALTADGIGGQLEVNRETLQHKRFPNVFGVGDCCATGAPKTAATIRKQAPAVVGNLIDAILDRPLGHLYDGTSGCPLLTRHGRCMMFEFDFQGQLVNEWLYQSTKETRLWWEFKVHGLKRLYREVMLNGYV
jgi:sulfide:quinone oxidoreductase